MDEVGQAIYQYDQKEMEVAISIIDSAKRIYVIGMGRSGYMMRAFAMRLMQMGYDAFVVGDTETPGAGKGDVLFIGSTSGETATLRCYAQAAKKVGAKLVVLTAHPDSTLGKASDAVIRIPVTEISYKQADGMQVVRATDNQGQRALLGSCVEISMLICTDVLGMMLFSKNHYKEEDMMRRHANLE